MKTVTGLFAFLFCSTLITTAQDEGFIYGKVYMIDNKTYEGPIRWGKEEVYWTDVFNSSKSTNENLRYLSSRERDDLDDRQNNWDWSGNGHHWARWLGWHWDENDRYYRHDYTHQFACQFGEIKTIEPTGKKRADLVMQNGKRISVSGEGYNDIGLDIRVMDPDMGSVEIDWGRINKIEFMKTPKDLPNKFGKPLFGTVQAYGEKFTGYIQWDHDERLSIDKLDGDSEEGDLSIEFGKIQSIERRGWNSFVVLKSGRELRMEGTNDVNDGNRGIIVTNKDFVSIDIPWREFEKVTFSDNATTTLPTYDQYSTQRELAGTITARHGKVLSGRIVFDLDEEFDYELLQGKGGKIEYVSAFRDVKKLQNNNAYTCEVELKSGMKFTLDDAQDVNDRNQGVLVFAQNSDPVYIPWHNIQTIEFK
jgi:hypothetical protein